MKAINTKTVNGVKATQNYGTTAKGTKKVSSIQIDNRVFTNNASGKRDLTVYLATKGYSFTEKEERSFFAVVKQPTEKQLVGKSKKANTAIIGTMSKKVSVARTMNGMLNSKEDTLSAKKKRVYDVIDKLFPYNTFGNKEKIRIAKDICRKLNLQMQYIEKL